MPIHVIIADDDRFFRIGVQSELKKFADIGIVGEARNGNELINLLRVSPPDVLLLDLRMPILSGIQVLKLIKEESIVVRTIVISVDDDESAILKALQEGAKGFFCKGLDINTEEIYSAITCVMNDEFYFNEVVNTTLLNASIRPSHQLIEKSRNNIMFSETELNIIRYISQEMTSRQIAERTHYTIRSLENIRQNLIHRVGAKSAIGLVLYAIQHRYVNVADIQPETTSF